MLRAGDQIVRNTQDSGVVPGFVPPQQGPRRQVPDSAFRSDGFDAPRPPQASSSVSGRFGEAALRAGESIVAAGAAGVGRAVEGFGFRNAERAAAQIEPRKSLQGRCRSGARDRHSSGRRSCRGGRRDPSLAGHADGSAEGQRPHGSWIRGWFAARKPARQPIR